MAQTYSVRVVKDEAENFLCSTGRTWLEEQGTVSPDGNPWERLDYTKRILHGHYMISPILFPLPERAEAGKMALEG